MFTRSGWFLWCWKKDANVRSIKEDEENKLVVKEGEKNQHLLEVVDFSAAGKKDLYERNI